MVGLCMYTWDMWIFKFIIHPGFIIGAFVGITIILNYFKKKDKSFLS